MNGSEREQNLTHQVLGLHWALTETLKRLAPFYGENANREIDALCKKLVDDLKNSDIPAEFEMDHAKMVRPVIDVVTGAFTNALRDINTDRKPR
jgi:hypothetical protein